MCNISRAKDQAESEAMAPILINFEKSQKAMKQAADDLLRIMDLNSDLRKHYGPTHKGMTKIIRDWNNIEHTREKEPS